MDPISLNSIKNIIPAEIKPKIDQIEKNSSGDFKKTMTNFLEEINQSQKDADKAIESLVFGEGAEISDAVIALEKAKISFQLMVNIRNTLLQSYQEIMRMQL
ncbi:flagellar hook-basal body complex protein FliE [Candidatus Desantisbacteria bacterium]|nr:flagellar hook-basal body complex protein FliE [Candidatus Desantisbacteria bacterium]